MSLPPPPTAAAARQGIPIQEWQLVLGDRNSRSTRTTEATKRLRELKAEYARKARAKREWVPRIVQQIKKEMNLRYHRTFRDETFVLWRCGEPQRVPVIERNTHRLEGDDAPRYGVAQDGDRAIEKFLKQTSPPTLEEEFEKYSRDLEELKRSANPPDPDKIRRFERRLDFLRQELTMSPTTPDAKSWLEDIRASKAMKRQWTLLTAGAAALGAVGTVASVSEEDWAACLELLSGSDGSTTTAYESAFTSNMWMLVSKIFSGGPFDNEEWDYRPIFAATVFLVVVWLGWQVHGDRNRHGQKRTDPEFGFA